MNKLMSIEKAIEPIHDGMTVMIGGFGGNGSPHALIEAIIEKGVKDLTVICNDPGTPNFGNGRLIHERREKKLIASFISSNKEAQAQQSTGELEVYLIPQGTTAEAIRAAGYGLGGVLTQTGLGTEIENDKQKVVINGKTWLLQEPLHADVALIYADTADTMGNLIYHGSSRHHTPSMATAADYVVCEAKKIVEVGELNPDYIHTQGVFVNALVQSPVKKECREER